MLAVAPPGDPPDRYRSRIRPLGIVGAIGGTLLFAWYLRAVGIQEVAEAVRRVGSGLLLVLVLSGVRLLLRAAAWVRCVESRRLTLRDAFTAFLAGDAIGNLTPLGLVGSEGVKTVLARRHLSSVSALSSLALENLFYTLSVAAMLAAGTVVFLVAFSLTPAVRTAGLAIAATALIIGIVIAWVLYGHPRLASRAIRWFAARRMTSILASRVDSIEQLEDRVYGFSTRHPRDVALVVLLEFGFHALSIAEVYILLLLLVGPSAQTLLQAIVLETMNRVMMVVFKFVPLRVGVDEAGSGMVAQVLGLGSVPGVALALTRKARTVFWSGLGVALLVRHGLSIGGVVRSVEERPGVPAARDETR